MATVFDVAKYILHKLGPLSTWKLQKLCYYSQAWSLAWTGDPLFEEDFEAWRNGPVCPDLFRKHRGRFVITEALFNYANYDNLTDDEKDTINIVLQTYGSMAPYELRAHTHAEKPWQDARGNLGEMDVGRNIITKEAMGNYYGSL